jgi:four helix bundle protein
MRESIIQNKSYQFVIRILNFYKVLAHQRKEFVLARQILKSGTSIGSNVEEALGGFSRKDFHAKLNIAYKEARETHYWLRLIRDSGFAAQGDCDSLLSDCQEILKIVGSIQKTLVANS